LHFDVGWFPRERVSVNSYTRLRNRRMVNWPGARYVDSASGLWSWGTPPSRVIGAMHATPCWKLLRIDTMEASKNMKSIIAAAALGAALWGLKRWLDGRYAQIGHTVHPTETWENEGGALPPHPAGHETSQVPR
jgi:hypothetical protein